MLNKTIIQMLLSQPQSRLQNSIWQRFHIDRPLFIGILVLSMIGLFILYSASNQNLHIIERQIIRIGMAFVAMIILAQLPPDKFRLWTPWLFGATLILVIAVLLMGVISQGAKRWLDLGIFRFQPSEIMKIALPMMLAWYLNDKPLPPSYKHIIYSGIIILVPVILIAKQPDLGTAILIAASGACVLLFAGMSWRLIGALFTLAIASMPLLWHFMHSYQRQRVLTFLNPERDPLGSGYHIIQSKIAIGSGGIFGKGWLHGTQSHLQFLPEHATDFIFAVCGEELGLIGCIAVITIYLFIVGRCLFIASQAQDTYTRLLAGSLTVTFFLSMAINIGMVIGILPVVGLPLPMISYGGTSIVTFMASFGMLMSIHNHRKWIA